MQTEQKDKDKPEKDKDKDKDKQHPVRPHSPFGKPLRRTAPLPRRLQVTS